MPDQPVASTPRAAISPTRLRWLSLTLLRAPALAADYAPLAAMGLERFSVGHE